MSRAVDATICGTAAVLFLAASGLAFEPEVFVLDPAQPTPGAIVRVSLDLPPGATSGFVMFDGRKFPGFTTGGLLNAYFGIDLDVAPGTQTLGYRLGDETGTRRVVVHAKQFATEKLTVASKYTELGTVTQSRVEREHRVLEDLWQTTTPARLWTGAFVRPTAGKLGSPFGLRRFFNGKPRSPHAGLDVKAAAGSDVYASNAGTVALARDLFFTGNTVVIDHGLGLYTIYAHLSRMDVEEGAPVARSARVGLVGATGRATGPHLHWGVKLGGARVDPTMLPGLTL